MRRAGVADGSKGVDPNGEPCLPVTNSAELDDTALGTLIATGSMAVARAAHIAQLLAGAKVLVAGGYAGGR